MTSIRLLSYSIALVLTTSADVCSAFAEAELPYKMVDSGFPVDAQLPGDINWIDSDRVLFKGVVLGTYKERGPYPPNYSGFGLLEIAHVWNVKKNTIAPYGDSQKGLRNFCSYKGYVSYEWNDRIYAGKFGEEKEVSNAVASVWRNKFSCKVHPDGGEFLKWRETNKRHAIQLLEQHGWLDGGPEHSSVPLEEFRKPRNLVLYENARSTGKEIPIPVSIDNRTSVTTYLPWADEYLVVGRWGSAGKLSPAWYLDPRGNVSEVKWPEGEWSASPVYVPTRVGLLAWASKRTGPDSFLRGHYIIKDGLAKQIAVGYFWKGTTVSPDGCKIAFRHARSSKDEALGYQAWKAGAIANTLRAIDVCEGEKR
jgi:hypothetical protein